MCVIFRRIVNLKRRAETAENEPGNILERNRGHVAIDHILLEFGSFVSP